MTRIRKAAVPAHPVRAFLRGLGDGLSAPSAFFAGAFWKPLIIPRRSLDDAWHSVGGFIGEAMRDYDEVAGQEGARKRK